MTTAANGRRTAMVGLGNMGSRIARRIEAGGHAVVGFDADAGQRERAGVSSAASLAEAVSGAEIVFLSLPDSKVIESVVYGDGLFEAAAGTVVVDLSTAAPASTAKIHGDFAVRGVDYLDAGISGGAPGAEAGTLTIMVGGPERALETVRPVLETFSAAVYHMGGPGTGHVAKLLNNFLNGIALAATAEMMVAARRAGLDLAQLLDVVNRSTGVNYATLNRFPHIVRGDYLEGGLTNELMAKDLRLYLELLQDLGVTSFTGPACLGAFNLATSLGYGREISNRVVDALGDVAGGVRLHDEKEG